MTVLLAALAVAVPHHTDCQTIECVERVAAKRCSQNHVTSCVHRAALRWNVSYRLLRNRGWCESRLRADASNGTHFGVFQFAPSTFATTPYAQHSIWSAKYNSLAAAWMQRTGRGSEWECTG